MENKNYEITKIELEGMPNTRDLGGMPTKDGRKIRRKKLLRSGDLSRLTAESAVVLKETYLLEKVIDLRTYEEAAQHPDRIIDGVRYIHLPVLDGKALGITREEGSENNFVEQVLLRMLRQNASPHDVAKAYMRQMYSGFLQSAFARKTYRNFFAELLDETQGSILWHCTAGKDRVGIGTMLLLQALNVEEELILTDYLKVNEFVRSVIDYHGSLAVRQTGEESARTLIEILFSVEASYLEAVYAEINRDFGSMDTFLEQEMGLDPAKRKRLQTLYLE